MSVAALDYGSSIRFNPVFNPQRIDPNANTGFADATRGTEPQWTLDTDLAELSADVYNDPGAATVGEGGWTRVDQATLDDAGIRANELIDPETGFQAAIYTDGTGRVVVAYAGTDPLNIDDWINNAQQSVGLNSEQYDQAIALSQKVTQEFGQQNVVFTGHSLGGGLASAASLATGSPAVTFNAAGVGPETLEQVGLSHDAASRIASDGQIRRYNVENDILTNAQQGSGLANVLPDWVPGGDSPLPDALGYEITLENPNGLEDPFRAHLNGAVLDSMQARDIKSQQDDNLLEDILDLNLIPMGPSLEDIGQTTADVAVGAWNITTDIAEGAWDITTDVAEGAWDITTDVAEGAWNVTTDVAEGAWNVTTDVAEGGVELAKDVGSFLNPFD